MIRSSLLVAYCRTIRLRTPALSVPFQFLDCFLKPSKLCGEPYLLLELLELLRSGRADDSLNGLDRARLLLDLILLLLLLQSLGRGVFAPVLLAEKKQEKRSRSMNMVTAFGIAAAATDAASMFSMETEFERSAESQHMQQTL